MSRGHVSRSSANNPQRPAFERSSDIADDEPQSNPCAQPTPTTTIAMSGAPEKVIAARTSSSGSSRAASQSPATELQELD